jgi:hypothetical protein
MSMPANFLFRKGGTFYCQEHRKEFDTNYSKEPVKTRPFTCRCCRPPAFAAKARTASRPLTRHGRRGGRRRIGWFVAVDNTGPRRLAASRIISRPLIGQRRRQHEIGREGVALAQFFTPAPPWPFKGPLEPSSGDALRPREAL